MPIVGPETEKYLKTKGAPADCPVYSDPTPSRVSTWWGGFQYTPNNEVYCEGKHTTFDIHPVCAACVIINTKFTDMNATNYLEMLGMAPAGTFQVESKT